MDSENQTKPEKTSEITYKRRNAVSEPKEASEPKKKSKKIKEKPAHRNIRFAIIAFAIVLVIVAIYIRLLNKSSNSESSADANQTEISKLINTDMEKDYPILPRDVAKMHCRILKCLYNDSMTEEDTTQLNACARKMFAQELLDKNPEDAQLDSLKADIRAFQKAGKIFVGYTVLPEESVVYQTVDQREYAVVYVSCNVKERSTTGAIEEQYLLVKEGDSWKILGWSGIAAEGEPEVNTVE